MAMIRATTAAENGKLRQPLQQLTMLNSKAYGITEVELVGIVEFSVALARGIRAKSTDATDP